jgi:hypothetical protein
MSEPTIICPNCKTEIKLTESLAAPLIESTRRDYEKRLALKDTDIARKEESLREREEAVSKAKQAIDDQVAENSSRNERELRLKNPRRRNLPCKPTSTKKRESWPSSKTSSRSGTPNSPKLSKRRPISSGKSVSLTMPGESWNSRLKSACRTGCWLPANRPRRKRRKA